MGHRDNGSQRQWFIIIDNRFTETMGQQRQWVTEWVIETMGHRDIGSQRQWVIETMGHRDNGSQR